MLITKKDLKEARTAKGGFTAAQKTIAENILGDRGRKFRFRSLVGKDIPQHIWLEFVEARTRRKRKGSSTEKVINPVSKPDDWSWQPEKQDIPKAKIKTKKNRGKNKKRRQKITAAEDKDFYVSKEWRMLRVRVLEKYECKCMMCGMSPQKHGIVIHVDHIKPRSKYPELSLDFNNLQLLCEDCNLGKSNKYETDWRPDETTEELDLMLLESSPI